MSDSGDYNLKQRHIQRGQCKSTLTRFETFMDNYNQSPNDKLLTQFEARLEGVLGLLDKFNIIQNEIELIDEDEINSTERDEFENRYYAVVPLAKKIIQRDRSSNKVSSGDTQPESANPNTNVRFPTINIPKFNGEYERWNLFKEMFISLIHKNTELDNTRKLHYLVASLGGEAAKVIEGIDMSIDNYQSAWDLLASRYQNKSIIIKNHVSKLVELPSVGKDIAKDLRRLTDDIQGHLRSLENLGEPVEHWGTLLLYILTKKLDNTTQREWETFFINKSLRNDKINFKADFLNFLESRCLLCETLSKKAINQPLFNNNPKGPNPRAFSGLAYNDTETSCIVCGENHKIYLCNKFRHLSHKDKLQMINRSNLCSNCLRDNHQTSECNSRSCKKCNQKHNTLLHKDTSNSSGRLNSNANARNNEATAGSSNVISNFNTTSFSQTLLSTAIIYIQDATGRWLACRTLLDSGSQANFITKQLYSKLKLPFKNINVPITGVGRSTIYINQQTCVKIKSYNNSFNMELPFLILDKITENIPTVTFDSKLLNIPSNIRLADRQFNKSSEIDILLGAIIFYNLLLPKQIKLGNNLPTLQQTRLGWVVAGNLATYSNSIKQVMCNVISNKSLDRALEKFWEIEQFSNNVSKSATERECELIYTKTTKRDFTGRFEVTLPQRQNANCLGESLSKAISRLHSMEKKFSKNTAFYEQYNEFMQQYESLGHMSEIKDCNLKTDKPVYYLPHHGVIKETSNTTKLRVVFDGSCPTSTGVSLNDILLIGPTIQNDLWSILIRFRLHTVVITGDIEKMYRQVNVVPKQRDLQRIVWRSNKHDQIKHYILNTVTYGTSSASFLAIRSLQQVALDYEHRMPEISIIIINDFYVDDLLTGCNTVEETKKVKKNLDRILNEYGFKLRKWVSNRAEVLEHEQLSDDPYLINETEINKTLGLCWKSKLDVLIYNLSLIPNDSPEITKRNILSIISTLFDPLGLLSPILINAKIIMQRLWQLKIDWDENINDQNLVRSWLEFLRYIQHIKQISIPRNVIHEKANLLEIHGFCDASQSAYAACIYMTSVDKQNNRFTNLLCSKTKVAPLKTITLPRLELCVALLLSRLLQKIDNAIKQNKIRRVLWCDSTIVLHWLKSSPSALQTFVSNRIAEIQEITAEAEWRHVPTNYNPADLPSRGVNTFQLINNNLWWHGPHFLSQSETFWPENITPASINLELRKQPTISLNINTNFDIMTKFSTLYKLQRVIAYCLRFLNNCLKRNSSHGEFSNLEMELSLKALIKISQTDSFSNDIKSLTSNQRLSNQSRINNLSPFVDSEGYLRVGGRLSNSECPFDTQHQFIISQKHVFSKLLILNEHHRQLHAGTQSILASLRERFWILNGKRAVRDTLAKCVTCFRVKPTAIKCKMADLPVDRVKANRPFYISGVDYAGPFNIKDGKLRNRDIVKAYLAIFICFSTKAVHLELVPDASANAFLSALQRFISRRGICKRIYRSKSRVKNNS